MPITPMGIHVEPHNLFRRTFIVEDELISNAHYACLNRRSERNTGFLKLTGRDGISMDNPTSQLADELFMSPAIREISLSPFEIDVTLHFGFAWSEVHNWIIACILRRVGLVAPEVKSGLPPRICIHRRDSLTYGHTYYTSALLPDPARLISYIVNRIGVHFGGVDNFEVGSDGRTAVYVLPTIDMQGKNTWSLVDGWMPRILCGYMGWDPAHTIIRDLEFRDSLIGESDNPVDRIGLRD